ncbi:hypothetical protein Q1695_016085 [Nippostrongylus brasiliensis]|nr:hypothetical protein Q1695_016085 [Nippostrongylus brasiliensis]
MKNIHNLMIKTNDLWLELEDDICSSDSSPTISPSLRTPAIALPPPPPKSAPPFSQAAQFTSSSNLCNGEVSLSNGGTPTILRPDDSLLRPHDLEQNGKHVEIQTATSECRLQQSLSTPCAQEEQPTRKESEYRRFKSEGSSAGALPAGPEMEVAIDDLSPIADAHSTPPHRFNLITQDSVVNGGPITKHSNTEQVLMMHTLKTKTSKYQSFIDKAFQNIMQATDEQIIEGCTIVAKVMTKAWMIPKVSHDLSIALCDYLREKMYLDALIKLFIGPTTCEPVRLACGRVLEECLSLNNREYIVNKVGLIEYGVLDHIIITSKRAMDTPTTLRHAALGLANLTLYTCSEGKKKLIQKKASRPGFAARMAVSAGEPGRRSDAVLRQFGDLFTRDEEMKLLPPAVNFDALKTHVMSAMESATRHAVMNCRDLIGGDCRNHFEPLMKLFDSLLVIGLFDDSELEALLRMIHPAAFDPDYEPGTMKKGLTEIELDEHVKIQLVNILDHLCDTQLRHRIESLIGFTEGFVGELQQDQCRRYMDIKQTDMPPAEAAKKTKEFRCPPKEQMFRLLKCKEKDEKEEFLEDEVEYDQCPMAEVLQEQLRDFCAMLVQKIGNDEENGEEERQNLIETEEGSWVDSLARLVVAVPPPPPSSDIEMSTKKGTRNFRDMIINMLRQWALGSFIESNELIRKMFHLLLRQYSGVRELQDAMAQTYVLHQRNNEDVQDFIVYLIQIRELLTVQFEHTEEAILKRGLWKLMNNRIFFQHPDLMRLLSVHENVMSIMMNILTAQQGAVEHEGEEVKEKTPVKDSSEMVVACSRFLCYFCRTSRQNQKAMFEHLSFLLDNATMLLARPSLRGSVPLDVAYSSFMDNNELALALKEEELDKVCVYLSRCGLQPNSEMIAKGYPDIGWDPVEGERYIDFLRFCVWINGENVEENANLVIRLLIRRPECLGIALKGEGQGLFAAFKEAIALSEDIRVLEEDGDNTEMLKSGLLGESPSYPSKEGEGEDYLDLGAATLDFYSSLVDLLAKCAPDPLAIQAGKGDSLRARAILRSLISLDDLGQILSLRFTIPNLTVAASDVRRRSFASSHQHNVSVSHSFAKIATELKSQVVRDRAQMQQQTNSLERRLSLLREEDSADEDFDFCSAKSHFDDEGDYKGKENETCKPQVSGNT